MRLTLPPQTVNLSAPGPRISNFPLVAALLILISPLLNSMTPTPNVSANLMPLSLRELFAFITACRRLPKPLSLKFLTVKLTCLTVNCFPSTVTVPTLSARLGLASIEIVTLPGPVPLADDVIVIQSLLLLTAVHEQAELETLTSKNLVSALSTSRLVSFGSSV